MKQKETTPVGEKEALYRRLTEIKLQIALLAHKDKETEALLGEEEGEDGRERRFFAETEENTFRKIRAALRRQYVRRFVRHRLPKIARAAAAVLLVAYLGLTTAVATVSSVRASLMKMLYRVEDEYTEIIFKREENLSFVIPPEWEGNYFPSYIPDGYALLGCSKASFAGQSVIFQKEDERLLRFNEYALQTETRVDTEGFTVSPARIHDNTGFIAENGIETVMVWSEADRYFVLRVHGDQAFARRIAENVIRVK